MVAGKKKAAPSKLTNAAHPSTEVKVNVPVPRKPKVSSKSEGVAAEIPGFIKTAFPYLVSSLAEDPEQLGMFKAGPSSKISEGPSNSAEEEVDLLSEEDLERQAMEVQRKLELLKAKRAKADQEQVTRTRPNKATKKQSSIPPPVKSASTAPSSSRLISKSRQKSDDRLQRIHESIEKNKGPGWIVQKRMRLAAANLKSRQEKISSPSVVSSIEKDAHDPTSSVKASVVKESLNMDNVGTSQKSTPASIPSPNNEKSAPVPKDQMSAEKHVIDDFLDFVSPPINNVPTVSEEPTSAVHHSRVNNEGKGADPELEELFERADQAAEEEAGKRKYQKRAAPTSPTKKTSDKSSVPSSNVDPEESEIIKSVSKKQKIQNPQQEKDPSKGLSSKDKKKQIVKGVTINGIWFSNEEASDRWKLINDRKIIAEGLFVENKWGVPEVSEKLKETGLLHALKLSKPFNDQLIREFIVNIPEDFGDNLSPNYGMVMVRGKSIHLSPIVINQFLNISPEADLPKISNWHEVAQILTNGKIMKWSGLTLDSKPLTSFYALLHSICIKNWMPVTHRSTLSKQMAGLIFHIGQGHKVNLGEIIFDQFAKQSISKTPIHPIGHPSTIQQLIMKHAPEIIKETDDLTPIKPLLSDWKLFNNDHHIDTAIPKSVKNALKRQSQGVTKKGKQAKPSKPSDSSTLFWLKKHLKTIESARKEIMSQIVLLELQQRDNMSESESSDNDSEEGL